MRRLHRSRRDTTQIVYLLIIAFFSNSHGHPDGNIRQPPSATFDLNDFSSTLFSHNNHRIRRDEELQNCGPYRLFICYAYEHLANEGMEMPEWVKLLCPACKAPICKVAGIGKTAEDRLMLNVGCRPNFCMAEYKEESGAPDCILPVAINDGKNKVLFPFNLCTREMLASGKCEGKAWSTNPYVTIGIALTNQYFVQCDAGFIVPAIVVEAHKKHGDGPDAPFITCVPSLHLAAGYAVGDLSLFSNYPYDAVNPRSIEYCGKGGRQKGDMCQPLPICKNDGRPPSSLFASDVVFHAKDCDKPCEYQFGATYDDCVFLDISNPGGAMPYFSARRALSGPYAVFMDETENLMLGAVTSSEGSTAAPNAPETSETTTNNPTEGGPENVSSLHHKREIRPFSSPDEKRGRARRQDNTSEKIQYPRCINVAGLAGEDLQRVQGDQFLNCDTNIFVQFRNGNTSGLAIDPPPCEGANDTKICTNRDGAPTEPTFIITTTTAAALSSETLIGIGAGVGGVLLLSVCGAVLGCRLKKKKKDDDPEKTVVVSPIPPVDPEPAPGISPAVPAVVEPPPTAPIPSPAIGGFGPAAPMKAPSKIVNLAEGQYKLITTNIEGGHMAHLEKMTKGTPRPIKRQPGRYDLAARGLALRMDIEKFKAWKSKQPPRPKEKPALTVTGNDPQTREIALKIIAKLSSEDYLAMDNKEPYYTPDGDAIHSLYLELEDIFKEERGVARPQGRTIVVGDLHGNFNDLWRIIQAWLSDVVDQGPKQNIIFLGDIVDRGPRQLECLILIMAYKAVFPKQVFIVRGNHEESETCEDFQADMLARGYSDEAEQAIKLLLDLFEKLPSLGVIDGRILCMHGMLAVELTNEDLGVQADLSPAHFSDMARNMRWNDPSEEVVRISPNTSRGGGQLWPSKKIEETIDMLGVDFVLRGHQMMTNGVRRFANLPLATVFSSSFYCDEKNLGAVLFVDPEKNAIVPIFIVNMNDKIETQDAFDKRLAEGWKAKDYTATKEQTKMAKPNVKKNKKK